MAIVFLPHNGIGLGHLSRTLMYCEESYSAGYRPVIFSQAQTSGTLAEKYPCRWIGKVRHLDLRSRETLEKEIAGYARLIQPAVVVEDTHPTNLSLPRDIRRVLIVRPTTLEHLDMLQREFQHIYDVFVLADSPDSPTWPYDDDATGVILSLPKWRATEPVYRSSTEEEELVIRRSYCVKDDQRIVVFTMGGGGEQADGDVAHFVRTATRIGADLLNIDPRVRLLFIKGPYFPASTFLPPLFEVRETESQIPALLKCAAAAVIRPGFNTTWECIRAGIPFVPVMCTSYSEPMEERIAKLQSHGIVVSDLAAIWFDDEVRTTIRTRCKAIAERWTGRPSVNFLQEFTTRPVKRTLCVSRPSTDSLRQVIKDLVLPVTDVARVPPTLVLRIDDVIDNTDELNWLLRLLSELRLYASLEVIPYLATLSAKDLEEVTTAFGRLLEVNQHGYSHLPRFSDRKGKSEFSMDSPLRSEVADLAAGLELMKARFGDWFRGGLSLPYDGVPQWLPSVWKDLGGRFMSTVWSRTRGIGMPTIRLENELWHWHSDAPREVEKIANDITYGFSNRGWAGLVLHAQLLQDLEVRDLLVALLGTLCDCGIASGRLSERAGTQAHRLFPCPGRSQIVGAAE